MPQWFQTISWRKAEVLPVEIERHTDASVWVNGSRRSRMSEYDCFFPTEKEAWGHLERRERIEIARLKGKLSQHRSWLGQIEGAIKKLPI